MEKRTVYILSSIISFGLCAGIVIFFDHHHLIRGFIGDLIVITLVYSCIKIFFDIKPILLGVYILLFAYALEFLQYFRLIEWIGLEDNIMARIIIGSTFDPMDLLAYTLGFVCTCLLEYKLFIKILT